MRQASRLILDVLLGHRGRVLTKSALLSGYMAKRPGERWPGLETIDVHISHLRKALVGSDYKITTFHGIGFRLDAPAFRSTPTVHKGGRQ